MTISPRPMVSVIMPVYNGERFIAEAIDSVLAQTFADWELIVVNDGSTDGTAGILAEYTDSRIRIVDQENRGLSAARNAGIRAANGEFLAFLDADDEWEPQFLARCWETMTNNPDASGVYTGNYFIDDTGAVLPRTALRVVEPECLYIQLLGGGFFPPCSVAVRTDTIRRIGMFDVNLAGQGTEDWDLWLRLSERYHMLALPEVLTYYRIYPGSMSTNAAKMHDCRLSVLSKRFGPEKGDPGSWPEDKRLAYGYANRGAALDFLSQAQPNEGWHLMLKAVLIYPRILSDLSTFYELACGDQPRGYRGQAVLLDLEANGADLLRRLDYLFAHADESVLLMKRAAYGNAYLALAMLSDQAGDWLAARRYMKLSARHCPRLVTWSFLRRLAKLTAGKRSVGMLRSMCNAAPSIIGDATSGTIH